MIHVINKLIIYTFVRNKLIKLKEEEEEVPLSYKVQFRA